MEGCPVNFLSRLIFSFYAAIDQMQTFSVVWALERFSATENLKGTVENVIQVRKRTEFCFCYHLFEVACISCGMNGDPN